MGFVIVLIATGAIAGICAYTWRRRRMALLIRARIQGSEHAMAGIAPIIASMPRKPGCMINPPASGCRAARRIESAWYPLEHAPKLPLDTCETPTQCRCTWMRVLDRRVTRNPVERERRTDPSTRARSRR